MIIQQEEKLGILIKGNFFGEISLIHNCVRTATVKSSTDLILAAICKSDLIKLGLEFLNILND